MLFKNCPCLKSLCFSLSRSLSRFRSLSVSLCVSLSLSRSRSLLLFLSLSLSPSLFPSLSLPLSLPLSFSLSLPSFALWCPFFLLLPSYPSINFHRETIHKIMQLSSLFYGPDARCATFLHHSEAFRAERKIKNHTSPLVWNETSYGTGVHAPKLEIA